MKREKKKLTLKDWIFRILFAAALAVFIFAAAKLIQYYITYQKGSNEYEGLQQYTAAQKSTEEDAAETQEFSVDFDALKKLNPDCIGWIRFEKLDISYPVMQGDDNDYYLTHTFEGQKVTAASIFMDCQNAPDFTDQNTFIYGHNMKDKTMFGILNNYKEESFYKENSYFYIYTPEYTYRYDIFSAYLADVAQEEDSFYTAFASQESFRSFLDNVKKRSAYDTGTEVTADDHVITLMTCNKAGYDYRFLIHAVQTQAEPVRQ